jgi:predicted GNAT family acetyltransferase
MNIIILLKWNRHNTCFIVDRNLLCFVVFCGVYSQQMKLKDKHGKLLYKTIKIGQKCADCEKANAKTCPHAKFFLPPWKSNAANQERCEIILAGDPELANRELHGMLSSKTRFVFQDYLESFKALPRYEFKENTIKVIHTAIDPSGGGNQSDFAMATHTIEDGKTIVSYNRAKSPKTTCTKRPQ